MANPNMIEAEGLSKYYGSLKALDKLSFSVGKGEVVGFLGPNGAGKSTAMNILTGFLSLSEGNVRINGCDIFEEAGAARASVGYLPEQPPLYLELTVTEFLHHVCGLKKLGRKAWKGELERILPMCSLSEVAQRKIAHLSKGFRQRVGLAQALVGQPPLLILDEPTVGLDPQQILEIRKLITQLSRNHTILLSSHILSEIEAVCQRVLILHKGQLVADDSTSSLSRKLGAELCQLQLEVLSPESDDNISNCEDLLAQILAEQGIAEFSCRSMDSSNSDGERLYKLEFSLGTTGQKGAGGQLSRSPEVPRNQNLDLALRKKLAQALAAKGFVTVAMIPRQRSLEDIFLSLTATGITGKTSNPDQPPPLIAEERPKAELQKAEPQNSIEPMSEASKEKEPQALIKEELKS